MKGGVKMRECEDVNSMFPTQVLGASLPLIKELRNNAGLHDEAQPHDQL